MNILKRAMGYMPIAGAALTQPRTRYDEMLSLEKRESPDFSRGECQLVGLKACGVYAWLRFWGRVGTKPVERRF